jgi:hypothetical protein
MGKVTDRLGNLKSHSSMKKLELSRRQVLGGMLATPVLSLTGCGGGSSNATLGAMSGNETDVPSVPTPVPGSAVPASGPPGVSGELKPPFVYFEYDGYADTPDSVEADLPYTPNGVTTTADRFGLGALCYSFNGSSSVVVDPFSNAPDKDYAVLMWVRSTSSAEMELLRVADTNGTGTVVSVNVPGNGLVSIAATGGATATLIQSAGIPSITDGFWHHLAIQKYGNQLQVFLDGVPRGEFSPAQPLLANSTVTIGATWSGVIDGVRLYNRSFPVGSIPQCVYGWTQMKAGTQSATGSLAAYYPFNGNAQNYLGYGVEGIPSNVTPTADRNGTANSAYLFNGVNSSIALNQPFSSTYGPFAIAFWAQATSSAPMTALSVTAGGSTGSSLDILFNAPGAAVQVYLNGSALSGLGVAGTGALTDGKWHFVVLQGTGTELEMFVDGVSAGTAASNNAIFFGIGSVVQFGCGSGASAAVANFWNGALDDVQIYEEALTPAEVLAVQGLDFLPRDGAGPLVFENKLWLLGGWNPAFVPVTNSEVWSSADGVTWTMVTQAPWQRRHDAGYAVLNGKMWIVGGDRLTGNYENDVWSSSDGINWQQVTNNVPWANRATQYVLAFNNKLWLMGGQQILETSVPPVIAYNDVWSSEDGANWEQVTPAAGWSPRGIIMGNVVFGGKMWVIGGGQYDIRTFNNDVWNSADGVNWQQVLAAAPWSPRQFHNITVFDNKIWVLAGGDAQSQGGLNDVWYSTDGITWAQVLGTPWIARHAASTFVWNNYLWLTCGSNAGGDNDVWKLGYAS